MKRLQLLFTTHFKNISSCDFLSDAPHSCEGIVDATVVWLTLYRGPTQQKKPLVMDCSGDLNWEPIFYNALHILDKM